MQVLECNEPGSVTGLQLHGVGLNGTLPATLGLLPLSFLDIGDNPLLQGSMPEGIQQPTLLEVSVAGTGITCHKNALTDEEVSAFAKRLISTPDSQLLSSNWSAAEQPCVDIITTQYTTATGYQHLQGGAYERCSLHVYPGSQAVVDPSYVFAHGCRCLYGRKHVLKVEDGYTTLLCGEPAYMWILAVVAVSITLMYVLISLYQYGDPGKHVILSCLRSSAQPGTLATEGKVCACVSLCHERQLRDGTCRRARSMPLMAVLSACVHACVHGTMLHCAVHATMPCTS